MARAYKPTQHMTKMEEAAVKQKLAELSLERQQLLCLVAMMTEDLKGYIERVGEKSEVTFLVSSCMKMHSLLATNKKQLKINKTGEFIELKVENS